MAGVGHTCVFSSIQANRPIGLLFHTAAHKQLSGIQINIKTPPGFSVAHAMWKSLMLLSASDKEPNPQYSSEIDKQTEHTPDVLQKNSVV